jgi:replicative DNA helicase
LIVVAARPGVGKSAFAQNVCENVADADGLAVFAALEMSLKELTRRGVARASGANYQRILWGNPDEGDKAKIEAAWPKVNARLKRMLANEEGSVTPTELRAHVRKLQRKQKVDLVVVDYIQLMTLGRFVENKNVEVSAVTRGLKMLAKSTGVPVMALSQMSRAIDSRAKEERTPQLSDLRDSGAIEQDADVVIFIHRKPEDYTSGEAKLIVAKNRNGPTGEVKLAYVGRKYTFSEMPKGVNG